MGTRHLISVVHNNEYKIAQYGQWDGYPSGQGVDVLKFCKEFLADPCSLNIFLKQLDKVRFIDTDEYSKLWANIGIDLNQNNGYVTISQSDKFDAKYPYFSRDNSAKILNMIYNSSDDEILLTNSIDFASDSLFCEWAYVVDLDKMTLEIFKGFNSSKLMSTPKERFANLIPERQNEYYPVKFLYEFSILSLPDPNVFLEILDQNTNDK
jgi:hypothetical protein